MADRGDVFCLVSQCLVDALAWQGETLHQFTAELQNKGQRIKFPPK